MSKTKRYRVSGVATVSASVLVEATSKRKALEQAEGLVFSSLCHHCTTESEDGFTTELDGEVTSLEAEEIGSDEPD